MPIQIIHQDITTLHVDAIVNAANSSLLGGGGVDLAIHRAAGVLLYEACLKLNGCDTGDAKITPGFNLPAKWVIHTVGPVWQQGNHDEEKLLTSCYQNTFQLAKAFAIKTIAFPAISTGVYGYPKKKAAKIAIKVMQEHELDFDLIIACVFSEEDKEIYEQALINYKSNK
jgi:O-acetyl-ADP-ribose deacetylase (regulator of RNase III)